MKTIELKQILENIEYSSFLGDENILISGIEQLSNYKNICETTLSWSSDENLDNVYFLHKGIFIVSKNFDKNKKQKECSYIIVENPRRTFQTILNIFFTEKKKVGISNSAIIDKSVELGENIFIGQNVVIEQNCKIGNNTVIGHNSVILDKTAIGDNVVIGSNNTIGGVGFGYEKNKQGAFELIPHIGGVIIKDNVEIGNNTCIDRAVLGNTILNKNVKVDNLVHIAHGVVIGENSVIIANAMIGGSTIIGSNVWVAPSASLINKISIADNSLVGMSANVIKNVNEYDVVAGNPAKVIKNLKK